MLFFKVVYKGKVYGFILLSFQLFLLRNIVIACNQLRVINVIHSVWRACALSGVFAKSPTPPQLRREPVDVIFSVKLKKTKVHLKRITINTDHYRTISECRFTMYTLKKRILYVPSDVCGSMNCITYNDDNIVWYLIFFFCNRQNAINI